MKTGKIRCEHCEWTIIGRHEDLVDHYVDDHGDVEAKLLPNEVRKRVKVCRICKTWFAKVNGYETHQRTGKCKRRETRLPMKLRSPPLPSMERESSVDSNATVAVDRSLSPTRN